MTTATDAAEHERRRRAGHAFIQRGWPVLPLIPGQSRPMACRQCNSKSPERVPHLGIDDCPHEPDYCHGYKAATLDHTRFDSWCDRFPGMNVGISTEPARLVVIDCDTDAHGKIEDPAYQIDGINDGLDVFAYVLIRHHQRFPDDTLIVDSPSGGLHLYWRIPKGLTIRSRAGAFGPLVDVKSAGGFITAPTSAKANGEYKRWKGPIDPLPAPSWLLHHLKATGHMPEPKPRRTYKPRAADPDDDSGLRALDEIAHKLATTEAGTRHMQLCTATTAAAHLVADGRVTEDQAIDVLRDAAHAADRDEREIDDAWRTALGKVGATGRRR